MCRWLLIVFFSTSVLIGQISFAANSEGIPGGAVSISLEALLNGEVTVNILLRNGLSIDNLIADYWQRQDLKDKEKKQFFKNNKGKINSLIKKEAMIKKVPKPQSERHFRSYHGNADQAVNANPEQLEFYKAVRNTLSEFYTLNIINKEQFKACDFNLLRLRDLHVNNYKICQELAQFGFSKTYGKKPALHFGDQDLEFELKAHILFDTLKKAFLFAQRRQLLPKMFVEFAKASGCLEARFAGLNEWHKEQAVVERISLPSTDDKLEITAEEAVNYWMHAHRHEIDAMPENKGETRKGFVKKIQQAFGGAEGCDGQRITVNFVQRFIEKILLLTPESSFDSTDSSGGDLE